MPLDQPIDSYSFIWGIAATVAVLLTVFIVITAISAIAEAYNKITQFFEPTKQPGPPPSKPGPSPFNYLTACLTQILILVGLVGIVVIGVMYWQGWI